MQDSELADATRNHHADGTPLSPLLRISLL
jgi:hypothetical protein